MASKRYALTKDLLQDAAQERDDDAECQFAIDNPNEAPPQTDEAC